MEQILLTTGYLAFLYGAYLIAKNYPADPLVKGVVLVAIGILLIAISYIIAKHRYEKQKKKEKGWDYV